MSANPVVLVHGFASSFELNWRQPGWVDLLQEAGREVIGVDVLGHGTAAKPHDPEAYDRLEQCIVPFLPDGPVDAIGFSMGSGLLLALASQQPERFSRLVVGGIGEQSLKEGDNNDAVAHAIESGDSSGEGGTLARAFAQFGAGSANDPKALAACMRRPRSRLTVEELAKVTVPTLVVVGDKDFVGSAQPIADALPDAKLVTLRNVDHFGLPKHFGFIDAALQFLGAMP